MLVFQCVGKIPNKLRGRVKNQHCPTHRVCTGQHVIGCYWQHLGSRPWAWTFVQQYKRRAQHQLQQTDNRAAWIFSTHIYIYMNINDYLKSKIVWLLLNINHTISILCQSHMISGLWAMPRRVLAGSLVRYQGSDAKTTMPAEKASTSAR